MIDVWACKTVKPSPHRQPVTPKVEGYRLKKDYSYTVKYNFEGVLSSVDDFIDAFIKHMTEGEK